MSHKKHRRNECQRQSLAFRVRALLLIGGLYVPWFFLIVFAIGDKIYDAAGWEVFFPMFLIPAGWPFAAGHVLLWLGAVCLAKMRWRAAMILGVSAALVSLLWMSVVPISGPYVLGPGFKIASMCALAVAGLLGKLWYGRKFPPGHCVKCGYNLTGNVSGRCPECGTHARRNRR